MSNVIEIGWCLTENKKYLYPQDYRRKESVKSLFPCSSGIPDFYYCPPVHDYFSNCFGIYSVSDINLVIESKNLHVLEGHKHSFTQNEDGSINFDHLFKINLNSFEYLIPEEVFISDVEKVFLEILPHPHARYKNIIPAKLNIHDWFRSIHIPYYCDHINETFHYNIKKGEPLAMIRFITPNNDSVKLIELDYSKIERYIDLRKNINMCNANEDTKNYKLWKKYFNIFGSKRPKNLIDYARIDK